MPGLFGSFRALSPRALDIGTRAGGRLALNSPRTGKPPLVDFFFGIPIFNIAEQLGVEDKTAALLLNVALDPLNFLSGPLTGLTGLFSSLTKAGKVARAGLTVSRRIKEAESLISAADAFKRSPALAKEFLGAVRVGDFERLAPFRKILAEPSVEARRFLRGEGGRAIKEAIMQGVRQAPTVGLSASARAGERAALRFSVPFTGIDRTLLSGRSIFAAIEKIPILGPQFARLGETGARRLAAGLARLEPAVRALDSFATAERGLVRLAADAPELQPAIRSFSKALDKAAGSTSRARLARSEALIDKAIPVSMAALEDEADRVAALLASMPPAGRARLDRLAAFLVSSADALDASPVSLQEGLGTRVSDSLDTVLSAGTGVLEGPVQALKKAALSADDEGPQAIKALLISTERSLRLFRESSVIGGVLEDGSRISANEARRGVVTLTPFLRTLKRGAGGRGLGTLADATATAEKDLIGVAKRLTDAVRLFRRVPPGSLSLQNVRASLEGLQEGISVVRSFDPEKGQALLDSLTEIFPRAARESIPSKPAISTALEDLGDDILSSLDPIRSTDFGRSGRAVIGSLGSAPADLAEAYISSIEVFKNRQKSYLRVLQGFFDQVTTVSRRRGLFRGKGGAAVLDEIPRGSTASAKIFVPIEEIDGAADLSILTLSPGRVQAVGARGASRLGEVQVGQAATAIAEDILRGRVRVAKGGSVKEEVSRLLRTLSLHPEDPKIIYLLDESGVSGAKKGRESFEALTKLEEALVRDPDLGAFGRIPASHGSFEEHARALGAGTVPVAAAESARPSWDRITKTLTFRAGDLTALAPEILRNRDIELGLRKAGIAGAKRAAKVQESFNIRFIKAFQEVDALKKLPAPAQAIVQSLQKFFDGAKEVLSRGPWSLTFVDGYFPRIASPVAGREAQFSAALAGIKKRFVSVTGSRFFKERVLDHFEELLALERKGIAKVEKNPAKIISRYISEIGRVGTNQKFLDDIARARTIDGLPVLMESKKLQAALGRTTRASRLAEALGRYVDASKSGIPALAGLSIHKDHLFLLQSFGPQSLEGAIQEISAPWIRSLLRGNIIAKGAKLAFSVFHASALLQTVAKSTSANPLAGLANAAAVAKQTFLTEAFGTQGRGPGALLRFFGADPDIARVGRFLDVWGESGEVLEFGLSHGLRLDTFEEIATQGFEQFLARVIDSAAGADSTGAFAGPGGPGRILRSPITGALHVQRIIHRTTWEIVHNSGKGFVFTTMLDRLLKKFPDMPVSVAARQAASSANTAMGGLNWAKIFGNSRSRLALQSMILAPDWTLSNLFQARDFFLASGSAVADGSGRFGAGVRDLASPAAAGFLARQYWLNWAISSFLTTQLMSYALNGHSTFDNPSKGHDLDLQVGEDVQNGQPIFLHTGRQFKEPFNLLTDPIRFSTRKAAIFPGIVAGIISQRDRIGRPITLPDDSPSKQVLENIGFLISSATPIPLTQAIGASTRRGTSLSNVVTGQLDINLRRGILTKKQKAAQKEREERASRIGFSAVQRSDLPRPQNPFLSGPR